jgi:hypothetical protein
MVNVSSSLMKEIFVAQKRAIRVTLRLNPRSPCKERFKRLGILTVPSLYIYSMMMFIVRNRNIYQMNSAGHQIYTRQFGNLHVSSVRLSLIQRGVFYSSIRIYNNLPQNIQVFIDNVKIFRHTLKIFLLSNAF